MPVLRVHQRRALDAIEAAEAGGATRAWVVLPPGADETLVGVETARRRGTTTVVLAPNTAVRTRWLRGWDAGGGAPGASSRDPHTGFTALTYESLAAFEDHDDVDVEGGPGATLHPRGRALVERLGRLDDLTLVLDDCHRLLEVWGSLLREVLDALPQAFVLGLTATPPSTLTREQRSLVDDLFGDTVHGASVPAAVREGDLAPFAELAWLTTPTPAERDWLARQGEPFTALTKALSDPAYGSTGFLSWIGRRSPTTDKGRDDAALRMGYAGLLAVPEGTRIGERHRHPPTADDWVLLLEDWVEHLRGTGRDDAIVQRISEVLPSFGYRLTPRGIRKGRTPVDRVLARSEAKTAALAQIVQAEERNLGDRLRMLVLCDDERAGFALLALDRLRRSAPHLQPLLVTGTSVAGSPETLHRLRAFVGDDGLTVEGDRLVGTWTSRDWVPWVTRFFEQGHSRVLVGTRELLGEGWDVCAVTGLVDLTTATTATSAMQTHGRALHIEPGRPAKVALIFSVVCVSEEHPRGGDDWDRFVRRHEGFFGLDADGEVVSGVGRVDPAFSPYGAPPAGTFAEVNARMLARSEQRPAIRDAWAVGTPYADTLVHTVRIRTAARSEPRPDRAPVVLHGDRLDVRDRRPSPWRPHPVIAVGVVLATVAFLLDLTPTFVIALGIGTMLGLQTTVAVDRGRVLAEDLARPPSIEQVASAVADALRTTGLSPKGADAVRVVLDDEGERRCALADVEPHVSAVFAAALDEVVSPMVSPGYVVPRWVLDGPVDNTEGVQAALGRLRPDGEVWHSVPTVLGGTHAGARAFAAAWDHWVGGGQAVCTDGPPGQGVLATHRGSDPFGATTVLRVQWR